MVNLQYVANWQPPSDSTIQIVNTISKTIGVPIHMAIDEF